MVSKESWAWARLFAERGVVQGDRVAVVVENRLEAVAAIYGAARAGAIAVPMSPSTPPFHLRAMLEDAEPTVIVVSDASTETSAPAGVTLVDLAAPSRDRYTGDAEPPRSSGSEHDPAWLIYTSGSTSLPKAVVSLHSNIAFATDAIQDRLDYRPTDVVFSALPIAFDYGLYQVPLALASGARLVLWPADAGPRLLHSLLEHRSTVVPVVPTIARRLCALASRTPDKGARALARHTVRLITNTGDTLSADDFQGLRTCFPGASVVAMFGLTECKRVTIGEPDEDLVAPGALGRPLAGTSIAIVDERGEPVRAREVGELVVRGPHVMAGYWRQPKLSSERFSKDGSGPPSLRTGDYGYLDEAGRFYFSGRKDGMFKVRGTRVSTSEIEAAAANMPGVEAAVLVTPRDGYPTATLYVASRLTAQQVLRGVGDRIGNWKVPEDCRVLDELPENRNGKPDRARLARERASFARLERLADLYGTPLFEYDVDDAIDRAIALRQALPKPSSLLYSVKANPHTSILRALAKIGMGAEVSSLGELAAAIRSGFSPIDILMTGPAWTEADLRSAFDAGARRVSVESPTTLRRLVDLARGGMREAECLLRVNLPRPPRGGQRISGGPSKFGIDVEELRQLGSPPGVRVDGFHFFQTTNVMEPGALEEILVSAVHAALELSHDRDVRVLNLGGGFPASFATATDVAPVPIGFRLEAALDECFPAWRIGSPHVVFESGRAVVGPAGRLVCRVVDVKRSYGERFVLVDSGVHHLGGMSALRRLPPIHPHLVPIRPRGRSAPDAVRTHVAGPLCTPLDSWGVVEGLGDVKVGDLLVIPNVGAYALSASLIGFLSHPCPAEIAISRNNVILATRRVVIDEEITEQSRRTT